MEGVSWVDLFNLAIGAFAVIGAIVYSLIRQKVDIEHMKKQITQSVFSSHSTGKQSGTCEKYIKMIVVYMCILQLSRITGSMMEQEVHGLICCL